MCSRDIPRRARNNTISSCSRPISFQVATSVRRNTASSNVMRDENISDKQGMGPRPTHSDPQEREGSVCKERIARVNVVMVIASE